MQENNNKKIKIALFFAGKVTRHLVLLKKAAEKLNIKLDKEIELDLISYNRVCFDSETAKVLLRGDLNNSNKLLNLSDYSVLFFRTTGKHWEEVNLILDAVKDLPKKPVIVDPLVEKGRPADACKAYQMLALKRAGIDVPKTIYGSLWYLFEFMGDTQQLTSQCSRPSDDCAPDKSIASVTKLKFPIILKGSGGDRGTRVFKADNLGELEKLVRDLRKSETEEGRRYMIQEFIKNDGDYRVLVLGDKVLGVMKRSSQNKEEFRNNYSAGGSVEIAQLPEEIKQMAIKAASVCGLWVAGVDIAFRDYDKNKPVIWEVNKGPQFQGFMKATGINVPEKIIEFLVSLAKV